MREAPPGLRLEALRVFEGFPSRLERFQEWLRPLECRAVEVEPMGHLALGKRVGQALSEPQHARGDALVASPTLRATAGSGFDDVRHGPTLARP